jgi:hypothetical protein
VSGGVFQGDGLPTAGQRYRILKRGRPGQYGYSGKWLSGKARHHIGGSKTAPVQNAHQGRQPGGVFSRCLGGSGVTGSAESTLSSGARSHWLTYVLSIVQTAPSENLNTAICNARFLASFWSPPRRPRWSFSCCTSYSDRLPSGRRGQRAKVPTSITKRTNIIDAASITLPSVERGEGQPARYASTACAAKIAKLISARIAAEASIIARPPADPLRRGSGCMTASRSDRRRTAFWPSPVCWGQDAGSFVSGSFRGVRNTVSSASAGPVR